MADITSLYQGEVNPSGKVNWRGDQVAVPQGGQGIYKTASIQLSELGSRLVVGDRVFRYALASGAAGAGDLCETKATAEDSMTAGGTSPAGGKVFTYYAGTLARAANFFAEGYIACQSGTSANLGQFYRIKSHGAIATTASGALNLYDELQLVENVTDEWTIIQNPYKSVIECTTGAASIPVGVAPVSVTSGDYFWMQTWGPAMVKAGGFAKGEAVIADATGQVKAQAISSAGGNLFSVVGQGMQIGTASENGLVFLTIAP